MIRFKVTEKVVKMRVDDAVMIGSGDSEPYVGDYTIVPKTTAQIMQTRGKTMLDNVTITEIPYYETDNSKGTTVYIAKEI